MRSRVLLAILLLTSAAARQPAAQTAPHLSIDAVLDRLDAVRPIRETAISPDGTRVAWVADVPAATGGGSAIYVRTLPAGTPRRLSASTRPGGTRQAGPPTCTHGPAPPSLSAPAAP